MKAEWLNLTKNPVMEWLITTVILNKFLSTVILVLVVLSIRVVIVRRLAKREDLTATIRRRWIVASRNAAWFVLMAGLIFVWFDQLRTLAATAVVIAAAIVIATKELLLNVTGFLFRSASHFFSIGDRIEIDEIHGDVIDQTIMGVTLLEIGSGMKTHQYTGRAVFIPNSVFLNSPVNNETYMEDYIFHIVSIPLKADADWHGAESTADGCKQGLCSLLQGSGKAYEAPCSQTQPGRADG